MLSFEFDTSRHVHMLICHDIGAGGWKNAPQFVRFGMDFLWHTEQTRKYSIVQIGTGRVGYRDGADNGAIRTVIANSFLSVVLFVYDAKKRMPAHATLAPLKPFRAWTPTHGVEEIHCAA